MSITTHDLWLIVFIYCVTRPLLPFLQAKYPSTFGTPEQKRLAEIEQKLNRLMLTLNVPLTAPRLVPTGMGSLMSPSHPNTDDLANSEVGDFLRQRKKINAIKVYREQTGLGLKDSKDAVDALEAEMRARGLI